MSNSDQIRANRPQINISRRIRTLAVVSAISVLTAASGAATLTVGPSLIDFDYITITAAISAGVDGDIIEIAPGLYPENLLISGKDLTLINAGPGSVTVFGQGLNKCMLITGSTTDVVLEGITFTNGFSTTAGAGVSVEGGSNATIIDCIIENNTNTFRGGGLYMSGGGTVTNTIIRNNTSDENGGGVYLGGSASKIITNCTIEGNTGVEGGGLAYTMAGNMLDMSGCRFDDNTATSRGGAIAVLGTASTGIVDVEDCEFVANQANAGGAIWVSDNDVFRALNSIFINNNAVNDGGVTRNEQIFEAVNCTFSGNGVETDGVSDSFRGVRADSNTNLLNCIVTNDSATSHIGIGNFNPSHSLIPEGPTGMTDINGNFNADPMFNDPGMEDYSLMSGSPAIDAGDSRGEIGSPSIGEIFVLDVTTDHAGNVRNLDDESTPNTGISTWALCIDLGAYEFQPTNTPACAADLNDDGVLNFFDVSQFLTLFGAGCP
ncbi:MAG: right-handed parallel beta-helix repeat-containing protein [Phycisphaerales bacterium]|nr:right-handed parallel beta-helix repeat-containing protein [Phycisphaerales bacterium]